MLFPAHLVTAKLIFVKFSFLQILPSFCSRRRTLKSASQQAGYPAVRFTANDPS